MSDRSYVPWARKVEDNNQLQGNTNNAATPNETPPEASDDKTESAERLSSRYGAYSSDFSSYRPSNYKPNISTSSYTPTSRERSVSRDQYGSTSASKAPSSYRTFGRSASTLTEKDLPESDVFKRQSSYGGFSYLGAGPHKTIGPSSFLDRSRPLASSALNKFSTAPSSLSRPYTSSTENVEAESSSTSGRYTYRTRPQPLLKKLDIPPPSSTSKPESPAALSPGIQSKPFTENLPEKIIPAPEEEKIITYINVTTRGTSPSLPSGYIPRTRRYELSREIMKDVRKPPKVPTADSSTQTDSATQPDSPEKLSRSSRFTSTPWTAYASTGSTFTPTGLRYVSKFEPAKTYSPSYNRYDRESSVSSKSYLSPRTSSLENSNKPTPVARTLSNKSDDDPTSKSYRPLFSLSTRASASPARRTSPAKTAAKKSPSPEKQAVPRGRSTPEKQNNSKFNLNNSTDCDQNQRQAKISPREKTPVRSVTPAKNKSPSPEKAIKRVQSPEVKTALPISYSRLNSQVSAKKSLSPEKAIMREKTPEIKTAPPLNYTKLNSPVMQKKSPSPEKPCSSGSKGVAQINKKAIEREPSVEKRQVSVRRGSNSSPSPSLLRRSSSQKTPTKKSPSPEKSPTPEKSTSEKSKREQNELFREAETLNISNRMPSERTSPTKLIAPPRSPRKLSPEKVPSRAHSFSKSPEKSVSNLSLNRNSTSPEKRVNSPSIIGMKKQKSPPTLLNSSSSSNMKLAMEIYSPNLEQPQPTSKKPPVSPSKSEHKLSSASSTKSNKRSIKTSLSLNALKQKITKEKKFSPSENCQSGQQRSASEGKIPSENNLKPAPLQHALAFPSLHSLDSSKICKASSKSDISSKEPMSRTASTGEIPIVSLPRIPTDPRLANAAHLARPKSVTQFIRISRSSSNCESSTESSTESSEESEHDPPKPLNNSKGNISGSKPDLAALARSQSGLKPLSRNVSGTSEEPSTNLPADESPISPQIKSKENGSKNAASFLMRALAPMTNLFFPKSKEEKSHNNSESDRMDTSQSISELPLDRTENDAGSELNVTTADDQILDNEQSLSQPKVPMRSKSQCIDWWLDENEKNQEDKAEGEGGQGKVRPVSSGFKPNWLGSIENLAPPKSPTDDSSDKLPVRKVFQSSSGVNTLSWCLDTPEDISDTSSEESESEESSEESGEEQDKPKLNELKRSNVFHIKQDASGVKVLALDCKLKEELARVDSTMSISSGSKENFSNSKHQSQILQDSSWWMQWNSEFPDAVLKSQSHKSVLDDDHSPQIIEEQPLQCSFKVQWVQDSESNPPLQQSTSSKSVTSEWARKYKIKHSGSRSKVKRNNSDVVISKSKNSELLSGKSPDLLSPGKVTNSQSGDQLWPAHGMEKLLGSSGRVPSRSSSVRSVRSKDGSERRFKIRHIESGEKAWWMMSNENVPEGIPRAESITFNLEKSGSRSRASQVSINTVGSSEGGVKRSASTRLRNIKRIESGERAWWMVDDEDAVPEGITRLPSDQCLIEEPQVDGSEAVASTESESGLKRSVSITSKLKSLKRIESGERPWWLEENPDSVPEGVTCLTPSDRSEEEEEAEEADKPNWGLREANANDMAWWTDKSATEAPKGEQTSSSESDEDSEDDDDELEELEAKLRSPRISTLGDRTSPDGLEMPVSLAGCWQNLHEGDSSGEDDWLGVKVFIGDTTNIDDLLGEERPQVSGASEAESKAEVVSEESKEKEEIKVATKSSSEDGSSDESDDAEQVSKDSDSVSLEEKLREQPAETPDENKTDESAANDKLDDAALQIQKDGEFGAYLDLDASISEQHEEFDGLKLSRKNSIVLRTQLSVRVHTIIEKLQNSEGRELQRALFSLKQIFQEDKDLVHEFVQNEGLACLVKVGSEADQNYQNYILRALGQVMLYVDGMNGVMENTDTVQWLYSLIASKFRLVVKTALKLLLVFIEYKESNCKILASAIRAEDIPAGETPWHNVMRLLGGYDTSDTELLLYACTLLNKTLNGLTDRGIYYDQVDAVEAQGMKEIVEKYMSRQGTDLDLLRQFKIYEAVLSFEDGDEDGESASIIMIDEALRKSLRNRKICSEDSPSIERKSRRWLNNYNNNRIMNQQLIVTIDPDDDDYTSSSRSSPSIGDLEFIVGNYENHNTAVPDITPGLKRRRERAERHRSLREQQESILRSLGKGDDEVGLRKSQSGGEQDSESNHVSRSHSRQDIIMNAVNQIESELKDSNGVPLSRENTVKDITQKLAGQINVSSPTEEQKVARLGDMSGLISKAMEGLNKSKAEVKTEVKAAPPEPKKSEVDLQWEKITENVDRPLALCDLDFTDLNSEDEVDILAPSVHSNGIPPPPPPLIVPPPAMVPASGMPPPGMFPPPPPGSAGALMLSPSPGGVSADIPDANLSEKLAKKSKKTVKLFWKEVRDDPLIVAKLQKSGISLIWDELSPVFVDTQKLEHLFESRAKDITPKEKQQDMNKSKEIIVLDSKRSNAINIGMTKLPPPRAIKSAILNMDTNVMNREGIEKLFTMLPTEDERNRIQEAQVAHPDLPLGNAEQFLLTLASITELPARLKLWAFKLDYENVEKEIAEPVMDLKQGMEILKCNRTFRCILSTLLSIGIFLNGAEVRGFQIEYLAKVPEVKDTVHKHSLLHHLCHMVMEKFPDATDLYSEIGAINRASKVDFDEIKQNIKRLETECKASWEHLKLIAKHDGSNTNTKSSASRTSDFLTDCAQRITVLKTVHRRIMNRYSKFLLWLGTPANKIHETKPNEFCRILSEFALEYRTTRERVIQQMEKKANHRERNKTRGRMITEMSKFRPKEESKKDDQLRQLLGNDLTDSESAWRRQRRDFDRTRSELVQSKDEHYSDDDEILNSLVKTATKSRANRANPRERKRILQADRKSSLLNRSRSTTRGEYRPPL
ncbi:uncharacterized protein LOC132198257 isoform X2 [Neocloeon triangulifer]|uniref:uncharacterized protein LOC132198257 isoform X2 n=1 Tax=Neocloeon triangulifer TaxID=2078957 RepID=UPI00286F446B|nr:uncharacterized protein LOC132198257 isoform X2 [Neocloeon triangulifer]